MKTTLWVLALFTLTIPAIAQSVPAKPRLTPIGECRSWELHILSLIKEHRQSGTSEAALGEALNLAYAAYAQCVMCEGDMSERAVAVLEVLSRGRTVASADYAIGSEHRERSKD